MKRSPRKYCGKRLVQRIGSLTKSCYDKATLIVLDHLNIDPDLHKDVMWGIAALKYENVSRWYVEDLLKIGDLKKIKETIDSTYLEQLRALSTDDIEDIIFVHDKKKIIRANLTVEVLKSELISRAVLKDSSEDNDE